MTEGNEAHPAKDSSSLEVGSIRTFDYSRCEACHREAYQRYLQGEHAKALNKDNQSVKGGTSEAEERTAPTCGHCHASHYMEPDLSRARIGAQMTEACGSCHAAQKASYLENYHGKTGVFLADEASAYCTDCHGAHNCDSLKDKEAALAACWRCHPDAQVNLATMVIHADDHKLTSNGDPDKQSALGVMQTVRSIARIIVGLVLGFFFLLTLIWILRELQKKLRKS
jgi:hypothetical protein